MRVGQDVLHGLPTALGSEWLLTNGRGGSASGTAAGGRSRPAHALLIATRDHGRPVTLLLRVDERLHTEAGTVDFARAGSAFTLESFEPAPIPTWRFRAGGVLLEKSVVLIAGHDAVAIRYRHLEGPDARLVVSPLVVCRAPRELQREVADARGAVPVVPGRVRVEIAPGAAVLTLWHNGAFIPTRLWKRVDYPGPDAAPASAAPGEAPFEHALVPGYVEANLPAGGTFQLVVAAEDDLFRALAREDRLGSPPPKTLAECVARLDQDERAERLAWVERAVRGADATARQGAAARASSAADATGIPAPESGPERALLSDDDGWTAPLAAQLLAGLTRRGHRLTFVSSFPTATERGVHVLRMVPALISIRAYDAAREVLRGAVEYLDEGLVPESFDSTDGTPRYGDPAPSLWLVHAAELYARRSGDLDFTQRILAPGVEGVMQFYRSGTRHGIRVEQDGLLASGDPPVRRADANVLWYHALVAMAQLSKLTGRREQGAFYLAWAREHQSRFLERFWDEERGVLHDRIADDGPVAGFTATQILSVSLAPAILGGKEASRLVQSVLERLLVPGGLREQEGGDRARPDWLPHFLVAWLRIHGRRREAQVVVRAWLDELDEVRARSGFGAFPGWIELAGTADAERLPHAGPDPFSALGAAEVLRMWTEDVEHEVRE